MSSETRITNNKMRSHVKDEPQTLRLSASRCKICHHQSCMGGNILDKIQSLQPIDGRSPRVGLEPTTTRLRVLRSTD